MVPVLVGNEDAGQAVRRQAQLRQGLADPPAGDAHIDEQVRLPAGEEGGVSGGTAGKGANGGHKYLYSLPTAAAGRQLIKSAALRAAPLFSCFLVEECFLPPLRGGTFLPPRRRRGLLFARAKRSKRSLKELRSLRILLHYGGVCFLRFHWSLSGLKRAAPLYWAKRLFEDVNADPTVLHAGAPGAVALEGPPSRIYPFNRPAGGAGQLPSP